MPSQPAPWLRRLLFLSHKPTPTAQILSVQCNLRSEIRSSISNPLMKSHGIEKIDIVCDIYIWRSDKNIIFVNVPNFVTEDAF
jgi:hypothetical protein